jgi:hypothetical protein
MTTKFVFEKHVNQQELHGCLILSLIACEAVYGKSAMRLEAGYKFDIEGRSLTVQTETAPGRSLARIVHDFCAREFGEDAFRVLAPSNPAESELV